VEQNHQAGGHQGRSKLNDLNQPAPDVFAAARTRRSIRAYKRDPVPSEIVREIVALGRHAPSGSNIQPWRVHVLTGATLERVGAAIQRAFLSDEPGHQRDYDYYTDPIVEPYLARRRQCGWGLYGTLGIGRGDARFRDGQSRRRGGTQDRVSDARDVGRTEPHRKNVQPARGVAHVRGEYREILPAAVRALSGGAGAGRDLWRAVQLLQLMNTAYSSSAMRGG
jgi:nitroreductase